MATAERLIQISPSPLSAERGLLRSDRLLGLIALDWRFELTRYPWVRRMLKSRWMPFLLIVFNLFMFTIILMAGWVGGVGAGNYNFGIMLVWILWWVVLMMVLVPGLSRFWCTMCPLPVIGEWLQRFTLIGVRHDPKKGNLFYGLRKRWPKKLSNMWLMNFLFLGTTFFSAFFTTRPVGTFILLFLIIIASIVLSMIYHKRTFCLYICPISGFQALYSNFAVTEVRVKDPTICQDHKTKGCVVGNQCGYGCPWLLLPYKFTRNTYCGMCMECFKTCEYDNMALNLRPPGTDLLVDDNRHLDEAWKGFIMLGIAVTFSLVMQGPWGFLKDWANMVTLPGYFAFIGLHALWTLAVIPALFGAFVWWGHRRSASTTVPLKKSFINFSYTLVPLGLAAWVAFSFGILLPNGSYLLHILSDPFAWGWNLFGTAHFPWTPFGTGLMPWIQIAALAGGLLFSLDFGYKLAIQTYKNREAAARAAVPVMLFLALTTAGLSWLFTG